MSLGHNDQTERAFERPLVSADWRQLKLRQSQCGHGQSILCRQMIFAGSPFPVGVDSYSMIRFPIIGPRNSVRRQGRYGIAVGLVSVFHVAEVEDLKGEGVSLYTERKTLTPIAAIL